MDKGGCLIEAGINNIQTYDLSLNLPANQQHHHIEQCRDNGHYRVPETLEAKVQLLERSTKVVTRYPNFIGKIGISNVPGHFLIVDCWLNENVLSKKENNLSRQYLSPPRS